MKKIVNKSPLVSVCVPVYNAEKYLRECIDSILAQTFTDFELLIVDDGSTDSSCKIIESYSDKRIRLIKNKHDFIGSLNLLLSEARGKYIARMDADDIMMPYRLKIQYAYMEKNIDIDVLGGASICFNGITEVREEQKLGNISLTDLMNGNCISHPTTIIRRSSIQNHKLRYEKEFIYAEDYAFWLRAILLGLKIQNLKDVFIKYRICREQVSNVHSVEQIEATHKVKRSITTYLSSKEHKWTVDASSKIHKSNKLLTVVIPFLNEKDEVEKTVRSIRRTAGKSVDIIIINDGSYDQYPYGEKTANLDVQYLVNDERKGVAVCRDMGVSICKSPYVLLLDAHMRFYDRYWYKRIIEKLQEDDRQLLCCQTKFLCKNSPNGKAIVSKGCSQTYGAYSPFLKNNVHPDIDWIQTESFSEKEEEIPTVLGAGYAFSKSYWEYLRGLEGLRNYGSDESYISFKVWLEGGKCILLKNVVVGHIYRTFAPYWIYNNDVVYNQLYICYMLFPQFYFCLSASIAIKKNKTSTLKILRELSRNKVNNHILKDYYRKISTRSFYDVLPLHQKIAKPNMEYINNTICCLDDVFNKVLKTERTTIGLYDGYMSNIVWLAHYIKYKKLQSEDIKNKIILLWSNLVTSLKQNKTSLSFAYGLSGIGWAIIYLEVNNLLEITSYEILDKIDVELLKNSSYISDFSFENGLGGIFAYLTLRLRTKKSSLQKLNITQYRELAKEIINVSNDRRSIFYSLMFLCIIGIDGCDDTNPKPSLQEWMDTKTFIPSNSEYWNLSFDKGVFSATLTAINIKSKIQDYEI